MMSGTIWIVEAYESYGVAIGFDDDIAWLDIKKFIQGIDNYFEEDDDDIPDWISDVIAKLRKFDGYTLYPQINDTDIS